jgi:hypothetical protein
MALGCTGERGESIAPIMQYHQLKSLVTTRWTRAKVSLSATIHRNACDHTGRDGANRIQRPFLRKSIELSSARPVWRGEL